MKRVNHTHKEAQLGVKTLTFPSFNIMTGKKMNGTRQTTSARQYVDRNPVIRPQHVTFPGCRLFKWERLMLVMQWQQPNTKYRRAALSNLITSIKFFTQLLTVYFSTKPPPR